MPNASGELPVTYLVLFNLINFITLDQNQIFFKEKMIIANVFHLATQVSIPKD